MATTQRFDELNNYFSTMEIDNADKKKRTAFAEEIFDIMLYLFLMIQNEPDILRDELVELVVAKYDKALNNYVSNIVEKYPDLKGFSGRSVEQLVDTTLDNIDTPYYLSEERAINVAETEANRVGNTKKHQDAIDAGYTSKTWLTMEDNRVRYTHWSVDRLTVGINDVFHVGNYYMSYPCDTNGGPEEIVNCRCQLKYGFDEK